MRCHHCIEGLEHCHEPSVEHADGTTECLGEWAGDGPCPLPHHLHDWRLSCAELDPPCPCGEPVGDEATVGLDPPVPERLAA